MLPHHRPNLGRSRNDVAAMIVDQETPRTWKWIDGTIEELSLQGSADQITRV